MKDIIGQEHLLGEGKPLYTMMQSGQLRNLILYGPAGTGKTTIAQVAATMTQTKFVPLNATQATVKQVREIGEQAKASQENCILFIDEIHRFSATQQDALLPYTEEGSIICVGATTENPFHALNAPLVSRSQIYELRPLEVRHLGQIMARAVRFIRQTSPQFGLDAPAISHLIAIACGDGRKIVTVLDMLHQVYGNKQIDLEAARSVAPSKYTVFSEELHYDLASAFQGSIQASDPDAAIYWLAKWLESGEDPRYIARRLLVSAAEDAFSNPVCTAVAHAAFTAACQIGRPECDIVMAQATILIAQSKRDKTAANAIWAAVQDVRNKLDLEIPAEMKDSHYAGATRLGHGKYHDGREPQAYVGISKKYLPEQ